MGVLTVAAREGFCLLLEDVNMCPLDAQAELVKLLEERMLLLGHGGVGGERCHVNFRVWGDVGIRTSKSKTLLHSGLWRKVCVHPLTYHELREVGGEFHQNLPDVVLDKTMEVFHTLDGGVHHNITHDGIQSPHASIRGYIKLLNRFSHSIPPLESNMTYLTESQHMTCLLESFDVFA